MEITTDSDLPPCLNTPSKQARKARQLAAQHSGTLATRVRNPDIRGFFSRTKIVTLKNREEIVIQFRLVPLDLRTFQDRATGVRPRRPRDRAAARRRAREEQRLRIQDGVRPGEDLDRSRQRPPPPSPSARCCHEASSKTAARAS